MADATDQKADENKEPAKQAVSEKELTVDGYTFKVDTDLLDDVDAFALINKIENDNQLTAVVPLMNYLIGKPAFDTMKKYFVDKDAEAHKDIKGYHPRMRLGKLGEIYQEVIKNFDPKD